MDPATMERYADWLDDLEKSDPKAYAQFIHDMQEKMHGNGDFGASAPPAMNPRVPDQLKFPGNKVMERDGIQEQKEGMYVDVTPGFVMKTTELQSKTKLFVNICSSEHIQIFSKKKKLNEQGEEQEGIHVPLSLGPPHEVVDHAQKTCLAIDVAVNPGVLDDCKSDPTFRHFVCELALQYLAEKYKFACDPQYKLPKLAYRGTLPPPRHYIRKTQTPVIQEVDVPAKPKTPTLPKELQTPSLRLFERVCSSNERVDCTVAPACEGGPLATVERLAASPTALVAVIEFSDDSALELDAIDIQLNAECMVIATTGYHDVVRFLPYPVQVDAAKATLIGSVVTLDLPVDKSWVPATDRADTGSAPWLLAQALAQDSPAVPPKPAERFHLGEFTTSPSADALPVKEDEILPEDRFHQRDMMSMHILDQRRREKDQKAEKAAREHAKRKAEVQQKKEAANAAGKTWAEMYPNEPETSFIDLNDLLNDKPVDPPMVTSATAEKVASQWKQQADGVTQLKSSLAFELLD
ncbi:hypothetical protein H310_14236 [Aphanomyces invadans]|uniref:PIH1 N-terminal domain-containing protein n=1 Tax=Aphanomyces invadans TaxID=157072 RepID=A0A024TAK4_9STRA|nr:hypothetical protein H310_14236 [Aphanomyces invadans]ETV91073.1 hypothetical protein H310_14236 [Aphanomyces invadans]|eukprot:XP_008880269.1 hypothetical protein H310_14236 [Aphanomyces invadans]